MHGRWLAKNARRPQKMKLYTYDKNTGKVRSDADVEAADKAIELKNTKDSWEVIDHLIDVWLKKSPEDFDAFKVNIEDIRETRKDKKFGQTDDKNMDRRLILVFPLVLQTMIRKVYPVEKLPFDKEFFREFAKRYKAFRVPEKI